MHVAGKIGIWYAGIGVGVSLINLALIQHGGYSAVRYAFKGFGSEGSLALVQLEQIALWPLTIPWGAIQGAGLPVAPNANPTAGSGMEEPAEPVSMDEEGASA